MINSHSDTSDSELVKLSKTDPDIFEELVVRYQERLFFFIKRISYFGNEDIEDLLQETFIKVYKNLNAFDQDLKFSTWIYQITRNTVVDAIRKKHARPQETHLEDEELVKIFRSGIDLENEMEAKDSLEKIKKIIASLPFRYKEVMILRFLEERTYEEIMDIVKKPKGTVAALINRGRKMIMKEAKEELIN